MKKKQNKERYKTIITVIHTARSPLSAAQTWYSPWKAAQSLLLRPTLLNIGHDQRMYTASLARSHRAPPRLLDCIWSGLTSGQEDSCIPSSLSVCAASLQTRQQVLIEQHFLGLWESACMWPGHEVRSRVSLLTVQSMSKLILPLLCYW